MTDHHHHHLYLSIAEFDIDVGSTVRAQLPSTIPVTGTFLSPMMETKNKNNRILSSSSSSPSSLSSSWSHFLADQMMPDGSDRNSRNTSWVILNRPAVTTSTTKSEQEATLTSNNNGRFANNGIKCCVFQMSSIAKWNPRACILSASTDFFAHQNQTQQQQKSEEKEEVEEIFDPVLKVVDLFDFCKDSPTFSFSKQSLEQSAYKPIGRLSTIRVQALGMLPAEKMKKVGEVFNQPPFRSRSEEYSSSSTNFYQQVFLDTNSTSSTPSILHQQRGNSGNSGSDNSTSYYCSSSDSAGSSLLLSSSSPKAFANIIGESSSCGIAFLRQQDLEKLVSWIETAKETSKQFSSARNNSSNQLDDNEEDHDGKAAEKCSTHSTHEKYPSPLYGTVVTVTKKMETAKRGSVNMSVCLHASPKAVSTTSSMSSSSVTSSSAAKTIQFLRSTRPFLETVAVACCDATAAPTKEEKLERIDKIAKSAYNFLVEKIIPRVTNMMMTSPTSHTDKQDHEYSTTMKMKVQSLAALSKRVTCRNYSEWMRILATEFTDSSSSLTWQDPNVVELLLRENNYNNDENSKPIVPLINSRIIAPSFSLSHHHKGNSHSYHCDITLRLALLPPSPLLSFDPSSVWFSYYSSNRHETRQLLIKEQNGDDARETTSGENTTTTSSSSYYENQHTPLASYHSDRNHLIINLIETFGTDGLVRILIHILMQRTCLVICRGGGGSRATEAVMALASLFDFFDDLFIANRVIPYASVSLLDQIKVMTRSGTGGVLAATVNPIFESQFGSGFDVLIDMDAKLVKFGGLVVSSTQQQQQQQQNADSNLSAANGVGRGGHRRQPSSSTFSSSSSGQPQLTTFDCYKHSKSSKKNAFVGGIVPSSSSESASTTTSGQNQQNQNQNYTSTSSTTGTISNEQQQQHPTTTTAASSALITTSSSLSSSTSTESSKSNLPAVCGGSVIIEKWYEELSNELHTLLLRRKNSSSSSGAAVMAMNYSTSSASTANNNNNNNNAMMMTENQKENLDRKDNDDDVVDNIINNFFERETVEQVHFEPNCGIEDEIRLTIVQEISVLLWSLARASSTTISSSSGSGGGGELLVTDIPFQIAESRVFFLGKWLGRCPSSSLQQQQLSDPISFGFHLCRLLRPLVIASSPYIDHLSKKKQENENNNNNNNKNTTTSDHDHHHLLEDELIVSFLQNAVRTTSNWTAEHWLQVTATSPRVLQVLATMCGHKHSVIRLLASMLLKKMRAAHPAIEQCASVQVNMFLHFVVDAAKLEFSSQLQ